jgi:phosphoglycerate dehydrogenase-like enzyme
MPLDVWIPAETPREARALLPSSARVHDYPPRGGWTPARGPTAPPSGADLLVASLDANLVLDAIAHLPGLRVVQTTSAGVDRWIGRLPPDVTLCDASGVHDVGVAEWVVAAILAVYRRLPFFVDAQRRAEWLEDGQREAVRGEELNGARVLILGFGSIGRAVAERLQPFGCEVVGVARRAREGVHGLDELSGLLPSADVVVVLLPLTQATRGLVGADVLARMKRGALLVNAARGPIVDTDALLAALRDGRIRAALDVTDPEPLPPDHPLWSAPGALITPHVAGDVRGELERAWRFVGEQIGRLERGEPLANVVVEGY